MKKLISYTSAIIVCAILIPSVGNAQVQSQIDSIIEGPAEKYSMEEEQEIDYIPDTLISKYRPVPNDTVEAVINDKGFYYKLYMDSLLRAKQEPVKRSDPLLPDGFFKSLLNVIIWISAISLFSYLIYKLFLSNSSVFTRNRRNANGNTVTVREEEQGDLASLISSAINNGNYRLAVRYLYLQSLKNLADRKFIEMDATKTNYQYVDAVRKHSFSNEFAALTLQYEYVWYGEYFPDEKIFAQIQAGFRSFNKTITG